MSTCSVGAERLNVMVSTIEGGREDPFNSLQNSEVEDTVIMVDLQNVER